MIDPSSQAVEAAKRAVRDDIRLRITALDHAARREADARIIDALAEWLQRNEAGVVCGFLPLRGEPDLRPLLVELLGRGIRVGVPEIVPAETPQLRVVEAMRSSDLDEAPRSHLGTRVPSTGIILPLPQIAVILAPGVAFDRHGRRLGRGRGFFDALLAGTDRQTTTVGVAYEVQIVDSVPHGAHDVPVDWLCTERGIARAG